MNCFTPYYYCANFGNLQTGEALRDFVVATVKTTNNPNNNLIFKQVGVERIKQLRIYLHKLQI
jgi:hypothetical protein